MPNYGQGHESWKLKSKNRAMQCETCQKPMMKAAPNQLRCKPCQKEHVAEYYRQRWQREKRRKAHMALHQAPGAANVDKSKDTGA